MQLREAQRPDLDAVAALERDAFGAEAYPALFFRQALDLWAGLLWVAETEELLGYALAAPAAEPREAWILALAVRPAARGRGAGAGLLGALLERLRAEGFETVRLTVHPENAPALRLYERAGFVTEAMEEAYFGPGEPRLRLCLALCADPGAG